MLEICKLSVHDTQKRFVAANSISIAHAHFSKQAWFKGVYSDNTPVGFLMLYDYPKTPEYYLWRFMIDARYQGLRFGRKAIQLLIDHVRTRPNAKELLTSITEGNSMKKSNSN